MTGKLIEKDGYFIAVINYKNSHNEYKRKQINTNLKVRGNKKEAEKFLKEQISLMESGQIETDNDKQNEIVDNDIIFSEYIEKYVKDKEKELSPICLESYRNEVKIIKQYFGKKLKLKDVTYHHIEEFYDYLKNERGVKNSTVKHYAVVLSPALRLAYRDDLIPKNPYEFMPRIKREKPPRNYYNKDELEQLFEYTDKTNLALIVRFAAYYGVRRSELLGLRWQSIDFVNKTLTIEHKILTADNMVYKTNTLKTESSNRTLPLLPTIEKLLLDRKKEIEHNKIIYGMCYNKEYVDYVFVDDCGNIFLPDYVTHRFNEILKKNNLKHIRFHDLRHSCASLLVASQIPMKNIQEWLGHANYNTTADVYSHLDFSSKKISANVIDNELSNWQSTTEEQKQILNEIEKLKKEIQEKEKLLKSTHLNSGGEME